MTDVAKQHKLRSLVTAWSDGDAMAQATTLADKHSYLLPRRLTHAQLAGLNGVVQTATTIGQITAFARHQALRAARAGRMDVKGYWDVLCQTIEGLEHDAVELGMQAGMMPAFPSETGETQPRAPAWLTIWLAQEFVQHLIAHSLYLGATGKTE